MAPPNLVDALLARGDTVMVIDNFATGGQANLEMALARGTGVHELDVSVRGERVVPERWPEVVFHLAAQIDVR